MASKKRATAYQYEPLVTPSNWKGDELRYSVRLTQILDDLYQKFSAVKSLANAAPETAVDFSSIYPIGSIYLSVSETSPAELFGGTWEQIKDTFLLAAGDTYEAGATGGEAEHTLTEDELPKVSGTIRVYNDFNLDNQNTTNHINGVFSFDESESMGTSSNLTSGTSDAVREVYFNLGGSQSHNNMPPYLVVYVWKRTA